jgi:hypothetical protein
MGGGDLPAVDEDEARHDAERVDARRQAPRPAW